MSLTINGNRTGRAGAEEAREFREELWAQAQAARREQARKEHAEVMRKAQVVRDAMSQEEYDAWLNSTPDDNSGFDLALDAKYNEVLKAQAEAESERISEWLGEPKTTECRNCSEGITLGQVRRATREMAMDAGDMMLEGEIVEYDHVTCPCCGGDFMYCQNCAATVGDAVRIAYGEAVELAGEIRARQAIGRAALLACWDAEAREADLGGRATVSGGEVEELG